MVTTAGFGVVVVVLGVLAIVMNVVLVAGFGVVVVVIGVLVIVVLTVMNVVVLLELTSGVGVEPVVGARTVSF